MSDQAKKQALIRELIDYNTKFPGPVVREHYLKNGGSYKYRSCFKTFNSYIKAAFADDAELALPTDEQTGTETQQDISDDKWTITLPKTTINNYDQLKAEFKIDESVWAVKRFNATYNEANEMYRVVAFLVKKTNIVAAREELEALKAEFKAAAPHVGAVVREKTEGKKRMLEINIPDAHFGKLAWHVETGYESYDTKIAEVVFWRALEALIERSRGYEYDQILFVIGNDVLNSDDTQSHTTRGTQVDTDGRYHKTFLKVRKLMIRAVERLRQIAPVKVAVISGNHDELAAWHLGDSLECWFNGHEDVEIDNRPIMRKYHQYGKCMLMLTHGDKGKREDYPLLMAVEQPAMFSSTKYREAHTGHIHQTKTQEFHGVRVRILPALCPPDAWHSSQGYVGNLRSAEAYIWDAEEGLIGQLYYNDEASATLSTERTVQEINEVRT